MPAPLEPPKHVLRRWKIYKDAGYWWVFGKPTNTTNSPASWMFVNRYDEFEEARLQVASMVDLYYRVLGKLRAGNAPYSF